jgi:hypothetical protein
MPCSHRYFIRVYHSMFVTACCFYTAEIFLLGAEVTGGGGGAWKPFTVLSSLVAQMHNMRPLFMATHPCSWPHPLYLTNSLSLNPFSLTNPISLIKPPVPNHYSHDFVPNKTQYPWLYSTIGTVYTMSPATFRNTHPIRRLYPDRYGTEYDMLESVPT